MSADDAPVTAAELRAFLVELRAMRAEPTAAAATSAAQAAPAASFMFDGGAAAVIELQARVAALEGIVAALRADRAPAWQGPPASIFGGALQCGSGPMPAAHYGRDAPSSFHNGLRDAPSTFLGGPGQIPFGAPTLRGPYH
jgi:hypothetical protein